MSLNLLEVSALAIMGGALLLGVLRLALGPRSPDRIVAADTLSRAAERHLDPARMLSDNDSTSFFEQLGDLVRTGPTQTNVNDFRVILVDGT